MPDTQTTIPDHTAVRVALWRALHVELDASPHVLEDTIGLQLAAPDADWRKRPDMDPQFMRRTRASIVARARVIEDLVADESRAGMQYVILGAGLDTFAQRRPELASKLRVFEVDQPGTQAWKRKRLEELGFGVPEWLKLVPVNFEAAGPWWQQLTAAGFDPTAPAIVASTGVAMYLTKEAISETLRQTAALAPGSKLAISFLVPKDLVEPEDKPVLEIAERGARAAGTPFTSFFAPQEISDLARAAGFKSVQHISATEIRKRYFAGRTDGLAPSSGEELLVASVTT